MSYENASIRALGPIIEAADAARNKANARLRDAQEAKAAYEKAGVVLLSVLTPESALAFSECAAELRAAQEAATFIEEHGGPGGARLRLLHTSGVFAILADAFSQREQDIKQLGTPVRKALAARRAQLTESGHSLASIEGDYDVRRLRVAIDALESAARASLYNANYCRRPPPRFDRTFDQFLAELTAPLPAVVDLTPATA